MRISYMGNCYFVYVFHVHSCTCVCCHMPLCEHMHACGVILQSFPSLGLIHSLGEAHQQFLGISQSLSPWDWGYRGASADPDDLDIEFGSSHLRLSHLPSPHLVGFCEPQCLWESAHRFPADTRLPLLFLSNGTLI